MSVNYNTIGEDRKQRKTPVFRNSLNFREVLGVQLTALGHLGVFLERFIMSLFLLDNGFESSLRGGVA